MSQDQYKLGGFFPKSSTLFLGLGILGTLGCGYSYWKDHQGFFASYLTAISFYMVITFGAVYFVLVQHVAKAAWSVTIRRIAETIASNAWVMLILFLPLLAGLHDLFHWTHDEVMQNDSLLNMKAGYLNTPFMLVRTALVFGTLIFWGWWLHKKSLEQDVSNDFLISNKLAKWSTLGLIMFALAITFYAFDWLMSLDPHWFSTIFGIYYFAGAAVSIHAVLIIISLLFQKTGNLKDLVRIDHYHDSGKLLFGYNVFWTYIAFSQFFLIWYATIPEETLFFHHRAGGWMTWSLSLPICHFAIPFVYLMSRNVKRSPPFLAFGALWLLVTCYVDIYWLVMPNFYHHGPHFGFSDISSLLAVGGFMIYAFILKIQKHALIPFNDPRLPESLTYTN